MNGHILSYLLSDTRPRHYSPRGINKEKGVALTRDIET